jgi:hypothetical protein
MWTVEHHAALNAVQGGFRDAWKHSIDLKIVNVRGRQSGLSIASQENARRFASLGWFGKLLREGYYVGLDASLSQAYEVEQEAHSTLTLERLRPPTLRGIGLGIEGGPCYHYSTPNIARPLNLPVAHDAVEVLLEPLKGVKAWLHQTHTPHVPGKFFPASWGLMVAGGDTQNPTLVCGYTAPDGGAVDYTMWPMGEVLKTLAA